MARTIEHNPHNIAQELRLVAAQINIKNIENIENKKTDMVNK